MKREHYKTGSQFGRISFALTLSVQHICVIYVTTKPVLSMTSSVGLPDDRFESLLYVTVHEKYRKPYTRFQIRHNIIKK